MIDEAMTERKHKLEEKRNLCIEMRPEFVEALEHCLNYSSNNMINFILTIAEKGRSLALLKDSSRRKRNRNELEEIKEEENLFK